MVPTNTSSGVVSFNVDHFTLEPGLYLSRLDKVGSSKVYTLDLRFFKPNSFSSSLSYVPNLAKAMHSIEHYLAVALRERLPENVLYVGPMGCLTGMYVIVYGTSLDVFVDALKSSIYEVIRGSLDVPCASVIQCGNSSLHDKTLAISFLKDYLVTLSTIKEPQPYPESRAFS